MWRWPPTPSSAEVKNGQSYTSTSPLYPYIRGRTSLYLYLRVETLRRYALWEVVTTLWLKISLDFCNNIDYYQLDFMFSKQSVYAPSFLHIYNVTSLSLSLSLERSDVSWKSKIYNVKVYWRAKPIYQGCPCVINFTIQKVLRPLTKNCLP